MEININTAKKEITVLGETKLNDLLEFVATNKYEDYSIISKTEIVKEKDWHYFPYYRYPHLIGAQVGIYPNSDSTLAGSSTSNLSNPMEKTPEGTVFTYTSTKLKDLLQN